MSTYFDPSGRHITPMRVPLHEVDLGMAVYHGNYYHLFQIARDEFLRDMGFSYRQIMSLGLHLTIVEARCEYRKPLHYDEAILVHTWPVWVKTRSLGLDQKITRPIESGDQVLCTRLGLNLVCVTFEGKATRLPKELQTCIECRLVRE